MVRMGGNTEGDLDGGGIGEFLLEATQVGHNVFGERVEDLSNSARFGAQGHRAGRRHLPAGERTLERAGERGRTTQLHCGPATHQLVALEGHHRGDEIVAIAVRILAGDHGVISAVAGGDNGAGCPKIYPKVHAR